MIFCFCPELHIYKDEYIILYSLGFCIFKNSREYNYKHIITTGQVSEVYSEKMRQTRQNTYAIYTNYF